MTDHTLYIEVSAEVRYWEDATINGADDLAGTMTPFRKGDLWCPVIRLADGMVMDWPAGMEAEFHFKVCDQGEYWLLDANRKRVAKWSGSYVPDDFLCHGDTGFGDYIIFDVGADGLIEKWSRPTVEWGNREDDGEGWKRVESDADTIKRLAAEVEALRADADLLDWMQRQSLDDFAVGLVVDAPHDGDFWCSPDTGGMYYGKTLREAMKAARKG